LSGYLAEAFLLNFTRRDLCFFLPSAFGRPPRPSVPAGGTYDMESRHRPQSTSLAAAFFFASASGSAAIERSSWRRCQPTAAVPSVGEAPPLFASG
jgi:hypothetical protein